MTLGHQKIGMGNLTAISKNIVGFLKNPEFLAIFRPGKVSKKTKNQFFEIFAGEKVAKK